MLTRLRQRDPATLEVAARQHAQPMFRMARALGFDAIEAEDLVQETFAVFLETLDRFEGKSSVGTWMTGILFRKAQERRRELAAAGRHDQVDDILGDRVGNGLWMRAPEDGESLMSTKQLGDAISCCLDRLPAQQRAVFVLREVAGLETSEICAALDVSVSNTAVMLFRARNRLRQCLAAKGWRSGT